MDTPGCLSIIIFSEHSRARLAVQEEVLTLSSGRFSHAVLFLKSLVCYCLDRASWEIPGHSGLGTHETEEAERMSVNKTFLSLRHTYVLTCWSCFRHQPGYTPPT